ncbi:Sapep family Mn(2+)-dependent dipeptidase [Collinsella sp. AGMB00827]|uniref:Sapep family Mn(2+)-dependent dipeptidase n=1 Tax=Collinsella ureilytica TaxID=2869515 RepID=A0ABS7MKW2_9ACTN|nr:Sapep family Mn(2+)-dependent dipeptidase [Collinsella urealyticum]MBY4798004.1 Sapep family Mn(2+)-dependent dipeptidase [Collinsella urealyticum]
MPDPTESSTIDAWIDAKWEEIVKEIGTLVAIPSQEDLEHAAEGMPFGPGPKKALDAGLDLCSRLGMHAENHEGYIGTADYPGRDDSKKICQIAHLDTVPCGPGWSRDPHSMLRREGYLIGRGTLDDKGPFVIGLYAMRYWHEQGVSFPYTMRMILGSNEETTLRDVEYYHEHFEEPTFLFTPDAEFPVCYGEKGIYQGVFTSAEIHDGRILEWKAGEAFNAIPTDASIVIAADLDELPAAERMSFEAVGDDRVRISAKGKGGHASLPDGTINAIGLIVDYLLEHNLVSSDERRFLDLQKALIDDWSGAGVGVATSDDLFGPLTIIGGMAWLEAGKLHQSVDSRYPTSMSRAGFEEILGGVAERYGASYATDNDTEPFHIDPNGEEIQRLIRVYNEVTGEDRKPFTIGGGTYAREFKNAAAFGPEMPWRKDPEWVGPMHGDDEGISEDLLKCALKIYILAIKELMEISYE